jgi:hypothetical protein
MAASLRANANALAKVVRDGERDSNARAAFNTEIAKALDRQFGQHDVGRTRRQSRNCRSRRMRSRDVGRAPACERRLPVSHEIPGRPRSRIQQQINWMVARTPYGGRPRAGDGYVQTGLSQDEFFNARHEKL